MRTVTTVAEFIALFRPLMWSFFSLLAIFCTLKPVRRVCWSQDWTSCFMSLTVCFFCFFAFGDFPRSLEFVALASFKIVTSSVIPIFSFNILVSTYSPLYLYYLNKKIVFKVQDLRFRVQYLRFIKVYLGLGFIRVQVKVYGLLGFRLRFMVYQGLNQGLGFIRVY